MPAHLAPSQLTHPPPATSSNLLRPSPPCSLQVEMAPGLSLVQATANGAVKTASGSSGRREGDNGLYNMTTSWSSCIREEGEVSSRRRPRAPASCISGFQMPLHYPRYKREDYEKMEGWKLDALLREYGLSFDGSLHDKRAYAMGAFLWPHQL